MDMFHGIQKVMMQVQSPQQQQAGVPVASCVRGIPLQVHEVAAVNQISSHHQQPHPASHGMEHEHQHHGKAPTRAQQLRRITKPLMEKKRRDRINTCLDDLKILILAALKKDGSQHKLEKADILELTVRYLQQLQQTQFKHPSSQHNQSQQATAENRYRAGYVQCAQEVGHYLSACQDIQPEARARVMDHMAAQVHQQVTATAPACSPLQLIAESQSSEFGHAQDVTVDVDVEDESSGFRSSTLSPALSIGSCESNDSGCSTSAPTPTAGGPVWRPW